MYIVTIWPYAFLDFYYNLENQTPGKLVSNKNLVMLYTNMGLNVIIQLLVIHYLLNYIQSMITCGFYIYKD